MSGLCTRESTLRRRALLSSLLTSVVTAAVVVLLHPWLNAAIGDQPSFIPVMLALVGCFDVLSIALLLAQFRDTGQLAALGLACAFVFSLVTLLGWSAAFPGVFEAPGPLASAPSTAPWLWIVWHTGFPLLLASALLPWPRKVVRLLGGVPRSPLVWLTLGATTGAAALLVAIVVAVSERLPVIIHGTDTSEMTRLAGPLVVPVVVVAVAITIARSWHFAGPERWAGLAAAAALGDVLLTLFSYHRFSIGWYAGRTMTIVSAGVVLGALLTEYSNLKRRLSVESGRLREQLERVDRLERRQHILLEHMTGGVVMQTRTGEIVASNQAARDLLELSPDEAWGAMPLDPRVRAFFWDGSPWGEAETPTRMTLRTGLPQQDATVGLDMRDGSRKWLSLGTRSVRPTEGGTEYVVTTMTDVTERHAAALADMEAYRIRCERIRAVLERNGPTIVFQPIVEMGRGTTVGVEALARFPGCDPPDVWFTDAHDLGMGVELELSAVRAAIDQLDALQAGVYLSVNVGPLTVMAPQLRDILSVAVASRVFLELTEHTGVDDYSELAVALDYFRALGTQVAVDDAGSGYASLQHVINLRPDIIKLDRALVTGIDVDPARRALAGALLTFAREIGATVVAEGIENAREQTVLRRLGVRYGQGHHLGRPGPLPVASDERPISEARTVRVGS